ncbi:MAG: hypothetical protein HWD82_03290 [Flavobacteriaceae bacterium]|nr:hypothetical protein [Flavobacteriaceae bacterium]
MKQFFKILLFVILVSCSSNDTEKEVTITLKFSHNWDGVSVNSSDFNSFKFSTLNGESVNIERLRYVVSNIMLNENSKDYQLVDLGENSGLEITFNNVQTGINTLQFTFGFADKDNVDGIYQDLNSTSFNVPMMLGGGYHYMQLDGKYKDVNNLDANFNYHVIRAVDRSDPNNLILEDTSFLVDLGNVNIEGDSTIEIKMNIAEWFKNPNTWDLNVLNTVLMPNFNAQKLMNANGKTVFSLGKRTQN